MIRVCAVIGTWQLFTVVSALLEIADRERQQGKPTAYEDYLLVFETAGVPDEFKNILQKMAEAVWPWKKIVWAYDLLTSKRKISQKEYAARCSELLTRIGLPGESVGELWVCWLTRPAEKLLFAIYPRASVLLYEDGLISYIPVPVATHLQPEGKSVFRKIGLRLWDAIEVFQPVWRYRRSRWAVDPRLLPRVRAAYLLLTPDEPAPETLRDVPRYCVNYRFLHEALRRASPVVEDALQGTPLLNATKSKEPADSILVLGQALSRNNIMSRDEELAIYQNIVETVLAKRYRVLWKEHPRIRVPFFDDLKRHAATLGNNAENRIENFVLPHAYPVELIADRLHLAGCVAGTSAAVFYLRRLYGIPCYTFAESLLPRMKDADVFMGEMVRREALPLSALPPYAPPI